MSGNAKKLPQGILRMQARKARAEHFLQCSLEPGKKNAKVSR